MAELILLVRAKGDLLRIYTVCESHVEGRGQRFSEEVEKSLLLLIMRRLRR